MKNYVKFGTIFLFSIVMLVPAGILPYSEAQITESEIADYSYKFDNGFYEKLQGLSMTNDSLAASKSMVASEPLGPSTLSEIQYYNVILVTNDKEDLINDLEDDYNAINIFNPENLDDVVTADVPIVLIEKLAENYDVVKIGDGELELESHAAYDSTNPFHTSIKQVKEYHGITSAISETGSSVTVGLIDINNNNPHNDLTSSDIIERINCYEDPCSTDVSSVTSGTHSNRVAGVVTSTGSSNSDMVGVAPDSEIILTTIRFTEDKVRAIDYLVGKNVDLILITSGLKTTDCSSKYSTGPTIALVIDHVVKNGIPVIASNGNYNQYTVKGISDSACSYNGIAVGNTNISGSLSPTSSRANSADTFINPELTAVGSNLGLATTGTSYEIGSGTSFSAPVVAGATAMLLDKDSSLTSNEIRAALLVGASFGHSSDSTASLYNTNNALSNYMNSHGFGKLEIANSLDLINNNHFPNIISDVLKDSSQTAKYRINANTNDKVKVLLTWNVDTAVQNGKEVLAELAQTPLEALKDYNIEITKPDGTKITGNSNNQNKEFAFFTADQSGIHEIKVSVKGQGFRNVGYTLGSSHAIDSFPFDPNFVTTLQQCNTNEICNLGTTPSTNQAPSISVTPVSVSASSGDTVTLTATATDPDGDNTSITWDISREDVDIDLTVSGDGSTATFTIPHHPTITSGFLVVGATATDPYGFVSSVDNTVITLAISPDTSTPDPVTPVGSEIFSDDAEMGISNWDVTGTWKADEFDEHRIPPDHPSTNNVFEADNCNIVCYLTLKNSIDMTRYDDESLQFYWYVDTSLDAGEYLKPQAFDGTNWNDLATYSQENDNDNDEWVLATFDLSSYTDVTDFKIRFATLQSSSAEDVGIDDVKIFGTSNTVADTTPPVISNIPSDIVTVIDSGNSAVVMFTIPTTNEGTITCDHSSGDSFTLGTTTVICIATDDSNNSSAASFDVVISLSPDTIPPVIVIPSDKTFEATGTLTPLTSSQIGIATATDNRDDSPIITDNKTSSYPLGDTLIRYVATDDSGNSSYGAQIITIRDTTSPTITLLGDNPQIISLGQTYTELGATASDNVDGDITSSIIIDSSQIDTNTAGDYVVTYDVTDSAGNQAIQVIRTVNVVNITNDDCIPPQSGDWIITQDCTMNASANVPANIIVQHNSILTISDGITLDVDLENHYIIVKHGSSIIIRHGGTIS